jgi:hypothetical protein
MRERVIEWWEEGSRRTRPSLMKRQILLRRLMERLKKGKSFIFLAFPAKFY